ALTSAAIPARFFPHLQSRQQGDEFLPAHARARAFTSRPGEAAFLQALGADPYARTVPQQNLEPVVPPVDEHKPVPGQGILRQDTLRQRSQTIKTASQIHWR